jgi:hypothetical protein
MISMLSTRELKNGGDNILKSKHLKIREEKVDNLLQSFHQPFQEPETVTTPATVPRKWLELHQELIRKVNPNSKTRSEETES